MSTPPASERVQVEWARRVEAEYRSSAITQHLTLWLTQIGASPDLIRAGLVIAEDELVHAEMSHQVLLNAGGALPGPLDRQSLGLQARGGPLEHDVLRVVIDVFCLGETVAVPLFSALRAECTVPSARACLDRVLVDEVRHRAFGWDALTWLVEAHPQGDTFQSLAARILPELLTRVAGHYSDRGEPAMTDDECAWGLMHSSRYAEILQRTWRRDYQPRFAQLGIDVTDSPAEA
ncbi:MAG: ferritin-like domain-containing protein [Bradymonadia bacterium]